MSLLEALNEAGAAEIIFTVDDEAIFLIHSENDTIRVICQQTNFVYDGRYFHCPVNRMDRVLAEIRRGEGSEPKDFSHLEGDEQLRLDQLVNKLYDCDDVGHDDEYQICDSCFRWVYTQPTSYCDSGRFAHLPGGELICRACAEKDPAQHLEDYLEAEGEMAFILDPSTVGLVRVNEEPFQNGLHHGMADDPRAQRKLLELAGIRTVVFEVEPSQFYVEWTTWVEPDDLLPARALLRDHGQLWKGHKGQRLVITTVGDTRVAAWRNNGDWQTTDWTLADEERWHDLWKRWPDEVYEFRYLTEQTWGEPHKIALSRFGDYDPTIDWTQLRVPLRQNPTPAQRCEAFLKGST